jgi:hypothetical protein
MPLILRRSKPYPNVDLGDTRCTPGNRVQKEDFKNSVHVLRSVRILIMN